MLVRSWTLSSACYGAFETASQSIQHLKVSTDRAVICRHGKQYNIPSTESIFWADQYKPMCCYLSIGIQ